MSLRLAVLALLTARPMTGFDLMRQFDASVGFMWNAPHTQIYPELRKLEEGGLLAGTDLPRGRHGTKRQYRITDAGVAELRAMQDEIEEPRKERDYYRLKASYMEFADPARARAQLESHREHFSAIGLLYQQRHDLIAERELPLLQDRLAHLPADQHQAVVEFKKFSYAGMVRRARLEVEWAQEGLELLDTLARSPADADAVARAVGEAARRVAGSDRDGE